jgi:hypothetical protein
VKPSDVLDQLAAERGVGRGYGEPYQTPDGTTVIVVTKPLGVFAIRDGQASWTPAVDNSRIALVGVVTGLLAAVFGSLAVLRQPPWPRITIRDYR